MSDLTISEARQHLAEVINKVAYGSERVRLVRRGKPVAAVISIDDLELLRKIEDRLDIEEADAVLKKGEAPKEWDEVKEELGL